MLKRYGFREVEEKVTTLWDTYSDKIHASLQFDSNKKIFSFLEGPPTANAPPALHHVEVKVFKDVMCRFKYMQGFTVPRKGGWDCHGLPVEVQVEKKLGLKSKKDVLQFGIAEFNAECKKDIFTFIKDWEVLTKRMANWIDLKTPYVTLHNDYIESVWWSLKELFKKDMLYQGHKVVPFCPRCETPLSSHEVALGYKDVTEPAITVALQSRKNPQQFFLAWTTTPWTLPSNVCLAVNRDVMYAVVKHDAKEFILAKGLVPTFFDNAVISKEMKGSELVGTEYIPLFPYFENKIKGAWKIVAEEYVTTTEGTGIVHQAPAFGELDYESCKKHKLPFIQPVNHNGTFTEEVTDFRDVFVKDADPKIIAYLKDKGSLFRTESYTHSYPFCWRCETPLLYYALVSWFIAVSKIRERLVEKNKHMEWYPGHIKVGRFGKWLEGAKDWALSRTKFWGTPLPIWQCRECDTLKVIGSVEELKQGNNVSENVDLHKPYIDEVTFTCSCKGEMHRIPDVIDTWYDSGAAPFAQFHYPFENKDLFEKLFPYDFIAEGIDQTRGWFYTMLVESTILFDDLAYKRCAVGGLLHDEHGKKMSKSKGNIIKPHDMFDEVGVDAVRLLMCSYPLGDSINFSKNPIKEYIHPMLSILWNSTKFAQQLISLHNLKISEKGELRIEDAWIVSRINSLTGDVTQAMDEGKYNAAVAALRYFITDDLSRWYIKLVRKRGDKAVAFTLHYVLTRIIKVLAPFAPYITEELYQSFYPEKDSVHFDAFPQVEEINDVLEKQMSIARDVVQAALASRDRASLGLRWPVKEVSVVSADVDVANAITALRDVIKSQTNAKEVSVVKEVKGVREEVRVNVGAVGKQFGKKSAEILARIAQETPKRVWEQLKETGSFTIAGEEISGEHLVVKRHMPAHLIGSDTAFGVVFVNKEVTDELEAEGFAREVTRRVQQARKEADLEKKDFISLFIKTGDDELESMLKQFKKAIKEKVGASQLSISTLDPGKKHSIIVEGKVRDKSFVLLFDKS